MRYLDVCAGISASTVAWRPLGWDAAAYSEIEAAPRAVLTHHYPDTPLHGDFTTIQGDEYGPIDLLVGGTPCQDFSVAGLRKGLAGERGNLTLEYLRLADRTRPRWVVWENVPGVLSIDGGRAFGAFLGGLAQLGYGFAYRVLDAQYAGVPQRRRRVFVVGCAGDWRRAAAVLLERHSLRGDPAPRREAWSGLADRAPFGPDDAGSGAGRTANGRPAAQAFGGGANCQPTDVATAIAAHPGGRYDYEVETFIAHSLRAEGFDASEDGTSRGTPLVPVCFSAKDHGGDASDIAPTLRAGGHTGSHANAGVMPAVAYGISSDAVDRTGEGDGTAAQRAGLGIVEEASPTLRARGRDAVAYAPDVTATMVGRSSRGGGQTNSPGHNADQQVVATTSAVRRLTPRECERLQGFPDDYTLVPHRGKPMADGPRYKALGNSMAVPVMRWIGERIASVEALPGRAAA